MSGDRFGRPPRPNGVADQAHELRSIGDAVNGWLGRRGLAQRRLAERGLDPDAPLAAVASCWTAAAGAELAGHAQPVRLEGDVLVIAVDEPALVAELGFRSAELLGRLAVCTGNPVARRCKVIVRGTLGLE